MAMALLDLTTAAQRLRPLKAPILVVAISALIAMLFTLATRPASSERPRAAGEAQMRLVQDEHALIADYVQSSVEAQRAAIERDRAEMQAAADAGSVERVAIAIKTPHGGRAQPAENKVAVRPAPPPADTVGPPLQLAAAALPPVRTPERPVVRQAREVFAAVARIPGLVRNGVEDAADWVIISPVKSIARLPERRFL
jgi:hypothetical protein